MHYFVICSWVTIIGGPPCSTSSTDYGCPLAFELIQQVFGRNNIIWSNIKNFTSQKIRKRTMSAAAVELIDPETADAAIEEAVVETPVEITSTNPSLNHKNILNLIACEYFVTGLGCYS